MYVNIWLIYTSRNDCSTLFEICLICVPKNLNCICSAGAIEEEGYCMCECAPVWRPWTDNDSVSDYKLKIHF